MGIIAVLLAAVAAWAFGAAYYMLLSKPWIAASGVPTNDKGQPANSSTATPYLISVLCIVVVAGMMRHGFARSGIDAVGEGFLAGLGIGLFFITPWLFLNAAYEMKDMRLPIINAGYAVSACAIVGLVLTFFA